MRKNEYVTPEVEIVEMEMNGMLMMSNGNMNEGGPGKGGSFTKSIGDGLDD